MIPEQLRRDDLLFVLVPGGEKGPKYSGWNLVKNGFRWNDPALNEHLERGGNIGCYPAPGSDLILLDIDDDEEFHRHGGGALVEGTLKYSAWDDLKKYRAICTCSDIPEYWRGHKASLGCLEMYFPADKTKAGGQCITPPSIHPNGRAYSILDNESPILALTWADILSICERIKPSSLETKMPSSGIFTEPQNRPYRALLKVRYTLLLEMPVNPRPSGNEIRGGSPFHDSSTGNNVAVNPQKGVLYCFRHQRGYDAAGVDAIRRGLIDCGDPYDEDVFKRHVELLEKEFPEVRLREMAEYKKMMKKKRGV